MPIDPPASNPAETLRLLAISSAWDRFSDVIESSFAVLYQPLGIARPDIAAGEADWRLPPEGTDVLVALDAAGRILGSAWLLPCAGEPSRQVRQVAVDADARMRGVGAALMREAERVAAEQGAVELWLNARDTAYRFYERLSFVAEGDEFINELTGIPHSLMRKPLR